MLTLVAAVLAVEGDTLAIDRGLAHGLRRGDPGRVFYRLKVGSESRRIEVGRVEVVSLGAESAVTTAPKAGARPGFLIEFEVPQERLSPGSVVAALREHLDEGAASERARRYLEELAGVAEAPPAAAEPPAPVAEPHPDMLQVVAGVYPIGLSAGDARFYNETPRHERQLAAFAIDAAAAGVSSLDFATAQERCVARGQRLPTEFEWEVAAGLPGFAAGTNLEWTSSWYLAYPGNRRPEDEYGKRFRVLRGASQAGSEAVTRRHFFDPGSTSAKVGFRCAGTASAGD